MRYINKDNYQNVIYGLSSIITWGSITFSYIGNGFSYALWAFSVAFLFLWWRQQSIPKIKVPAYIAKAFISLYGTLFLVGILQCDISNLWGKQFSALDLLYITAPFWMILLIGWNDDLRKIVSLTILGNMWAFSLYGLYIYIFSEQKRFASFYRYPTETGMMLDLLIPCTVAIGAYYWKYNWYRWMTVPLILLEVAALILSETRGSYLALAIASGGTLAIWLFYIKAQISRKLKVILSACVLIIICIFVGYIVMIGTESKSRMVGGERLLMLESSYHMWEDHKAIGIGLSKWEESYNNLNSPYKPVEGRETTNIMPHNIFVHFGATGGIVSLGAFFVYLFFMMKYLLSMIRQYTDNPFSWMMLFMFIAFISHGLVDGTIISRNIGRAFYLLLGVGILFTTRWYRGDH